jgi:hypothetical protein
MFSALCLSAFAGLSLPDELVDVLVSKRVVVVERQVRVDLAIRTGDPLGSRAEGTLKTLAEPSLALAHKKEGLLRAGGRQAVSKDDGERALEPVGVEVLVTPALRLDGKIQLDGIIRETEVNVARGVRTKDGFVPGIDEQTVRFSALVSPGQRVKVRVSSRSVSDQTWVEFEAKVSEPVGAPLKPSK